MQSRAKDRAAFDAQAIARAETIDVPLADWQVFTLLGGTAAGSLSLGIAALYLLSVLVS